jgi:hypothetical protein
VEVEVVADGATLCKGRKGIFQTSFFSGGWWIFMKAFSFVRLSLWIISEVGLVGDFHIAHACKQGRREILCYRYRHGYFLLRRRVTQNKGIVDGSGLYTHCLVVKKTSKKLNT